MRFGVLLAAAVRFNVWLFRIIERHEDEVQQRSEQLAAVHKAALTLTKEIDLATVLQSVVNEAGTLANAQYGAVGVLNEDGKYIDQFILTDKLNPAGNVTTFSEQDQQLLEMFATQDAIAIKNAQFHRQSQQLTILKERDRFGMDLHDGVIQSIYGIGLMLEEAQLRVETQAEGGKDLISQAVEGLRRTIHDIRNYIMDLRPQRFQGRDLRED